MSKYGIIMEYIKDNKKDDYKLSFEEVEKN